ncbi:Alpha-1,3-mannosyltransferase-like protein [Tulasnella sp. JGI-2019a]|nr:Alpha-1,3-mannosyltransferase-like protein [Tulasnella sp. JGI-2019a]KAG9008603.1 Alpha-1,3-mannosyltransferase-like protein [Tulasnella sp. JGI-2019a]
MAQIESVDPSEETNAAQAPLHIAVLHPDLGIGGAERLIVDASLGLQQRGHAVEIFTSHHDPKHSFEETNNGELRVTVISPSFIPRSLFGAFHIYLAIFRQLYLVLVLLSDIYIGQTKKPCDVFIVDQLSACIPFLRWITGRRVVFYCHFPDKLLADGKEANVQAPKKRGLLQRLYRGPADWAEERSTGYSDVILANSQFTAQVFKKSFPSVDQELEVVYPGINIAAYGGPLPDVSAPDVAAIYSSRPTLVSMNRFENKKNLKLALDSVAVLLKSKSSTDPALKDIRLVLAGGYDPRLPDNVQTLTSLISTAQTHSLSWHVVANGTTPLPPVGLAGSAPGVSADVTFLLNFTTAQRQYLLRSPNTICLLYTPGNEHFGIGPVEAMACGLPVIACPTGGPTESLVNIASSSSIGAGTGWLRIPDAEEWATALQEIVQLSPSDREAMASRAKTRVKENFSMEKMCASFEKALYEATAMGTVDDSPFHWSDFAGGTIVILCLSLWAYLAGVASLGTIPAIVLTVVGLGNAIRGAIKANRANE